MLSKNIGFTPQEGLGNEMHKIGPLLGFESSVFLVGVRTYVDYVLNFG